MLRGTLKSLATYSLIAALVASPVMAATPGAASRQASSHGKSTRQADETAAIPGAIRNAFGLRSANQGNNIQQVVGKQPGSRQAEPQRGRSLLTNLFGGSDSGSASPRSSSTQRRPTAQRTQAPGNGILSDLFGDRNEDAPRAAHPAARQPDQPVDWNGIPYHQARSRSASQAPKPIRDPSPNETRLSGQSRLADAPRRSAAPASSLPKPPSLAAAPSSRRTVPAKVVSSRLEKSEAPVLSPLSSSRRSDRRDVPTLDASEIAAAKAAKVSEEDLVPKISRRRIRPESKTATADSQKPEVISKTPAVAKSIRPAPRPTPSAEVATTVVPKVAKSSRRVKAETAPEPETETVSPSDQAVAADAAAQADGDSPETMTPENVSPEPKQPTSAEIESVAADRDTPQPVAENDAATTPTPDQIAATPEATPQPADNFQHARSAAPAPAAVATPSQPAAPIAAMPSAPAMPQFVAPQLPAPSAPHFGPTGTVAGHRAGPPATAFAPRTASRAPLKPAGTPIGPATAPIGSGIATSAPAPAPRVAQNPYQYGQDPYAAPPAQRDVASPKQPSVAQSNLPSHLGTPVQAMQQPTAQYQPYQNFQQSSPQSPLPPQHADTPSIETPALPASNEGSLAGQPAPRAVAPSAQSVEAAFNGTPFAPAASPSRPAMRPESEQLSPEQTAVASELPGIRVVTHGPRSVVIRQTHEFEIRVENRGSIDAAGLMVRAVIPDWAEVKGQTASRGDVDNQQDDSSDRLVWTIDSLPAGSTEKLFVRLQALRSGRHGMDVDWTLLPQKSIATIEVREPKLDLIIEGPEQVVFGESQTYRVRVLNPGDGVAPNVVFTLSPNSSTPQTQRIGNIPSGKEAQFEVELTAQDLGDLKIHGLASGELGLKAEAEKNIRVAAAELESVLAGPEMKYQNTDGVYLLQVTNKGTTASKNVIAELALPSGVQYRGGIDSARPQGTKLVWQIDTLPPGATREYEFTCLMAAPGKQVFEFAAAGTAAGKTAVALDTQVESIADLVMTIQDPAAPAPVGSEVVYEILIKNRGSRQATGVRAIAQFSEGIEPRRIEGHTGQVLTGQVLFDPIEAIRPGQEVRIRVIAEAEREGHHRFRTEIRSGETVLVAEEATQFLAKRGQRVSRRSSSSSLR